MVSDHHAYSSPLHRRRYRGGHFDTVPIGVFRISAIGEGYVHVAGSALALKTLSSARKAEIIMNCCLDGQLVFVITDGLTKGSVVLLIERAAITSQSMSR